jgi:putative transposase
VPRRARLSIAGIPWHIIQRGNNRGACFFAEEDYRRYLGALEELAKKQACAIHAYVLMTNHVHLLLTPAREESAGLLMKHLGQRYVQYVNRTYRRTGTLWEGRFRSCLTQSEHYVLSCYRYIELNPVRAGLVTHPHDYHWSSYRANAEGKLDSLIMPHYEYLRLGSDDAERRWAYGELFRAHMEPEHIAEIRKATNGNYALGNHRFRKEIEQMLNRRATPGESGRRATKKKEVVDG